MSCAVFSGVGDDLVTNCELIRRESRSLDVSSHKLLTLFVVEWVAEPDAEACVILLENLYHIIISDEFSLMELCKDQFGRGLQVNEQWRTHMILNLGICGSENGASTRNHCGL
jgi:hypothetical protein